MHRFGLKHIFLVQLVLVAAAFAGLLVLLTEQQRIEFRATLHDRLNVQLQAAAYAVITPFNTRTGVSNAFVSSYLDAIERAPHLAPGANSTTLAGEPVHFFNNHFYAIAAVDPLVKFVTFQSRTDLPRAGTTTGATQWAVVGLDSFKVFAAIGGRANACVGIPPIDLRATCPYLASDNYDDTSVGADWYLRAFPNRTAWLIPGSFFDSTVNRRLPLISLITTRGWHAQQNVPQYVAAVILNIPHIQSSLAGQRISDQSTIALFHYDDEYSATGATGPRGTCFILAHIGAGITDYNETIGSSTDTVTMWQCGRTPNAVFDQVWRSAHAACTNDASVLATPRPECTSGITFEIGSGDDERVVTALRARTPQRLDLMLAQSTPRTFFYAASERARTVGIVIGAIAAAAVAGASVGILLALQRPIVALQRKMVHAARMEDDSTGGTATSSHTDEPLLAECAKLTATFRAMHLKLILARPFLPVALLAAMTSDGTNASSRDGGEADNDSEGEDMQVSESDGQPTTSRRPSMFPTATASSSEYDMGGLVSPADGEERDSNSHSTGHHTPQHGIAITTTGIRSPATNACLASRRVAVLAINLKFIGSVLNQRHALGLSGSGPHAVRVLGALVQLVEAAANAHRGVIQSFHGDRVVVALNAVRVCASPAAAAAKTALAIAKQWPAALQAVQRVDGASDSFAASGQRRTADTSMASALPAHPLSMGLSAGRALVGPLGTASIQAPCILGDAFTEAARLEHAFSKRLIGSDLFHHSSSSASIGSCLVAEPLFAEVAAAAEVLVVGCIQREYLGARAPSCCSAGPTPRGPMQNPPTAPSSRLIAVGVLAPLTKDADGNNSRVDNCASGDEHTKKTTPDGLVRALNRLLVEGIIRGGGPPANSLSPQSPTDPHRGPSSQSLFPPPPPTQQHPSQLLLSAPVPSVVSLPPLFVTASKPPLDYHMWTSKLEALLFPENNKSVDTTAVLAMMSTITPTMTAADTEINTSRNHLLSMDSNSPVGAWVHYWQSVWSKQSTTTTENATTASRLDFLRLPSEGGWAECKTVVTYI